MISGADEEWRKMRHVTTRARIVRATTTEMRSMRALLRAMATAYRGAYNGGERF
jgi:hypothetical protein